uniref:Uncharacterized protein n=1 Tax=Cacopsylla melanoneura TaxID=428564 RepID=A0A8D9EC40_9HEMI
MSCVTKMLLQILSPSPLLSLSYLLPLFHLSLPFTHSFSTLFCILNVTTSSSPLSSRPTPYILFPFLFESYNIPSPYSSPLALFLPLFTPLPIPPFLPLFLVYASSILSIHPFPPYSLPPRMHHPPSPTSSF